MEADKINEVNKMAKLIWQKPTIQEFNCDVVVTLKRKQMTLERQEEVKKANDLYNIIYFHEHKTELMEMFGCLTKKHPYGAVPSMR